MLVFVIFVINLILTPCFPFGLPTWLFKIVIYFVRILRNSHLASTMLSFQRKFRTELLDLKHVVNGIVFQSGSKLVVNGNTFQ